MPLTSKVQKGLFILGSFIVLLLSVLLYWRINELVKSFARINHTNTIELKLELVLSYLKDAETAQRGFLTTQDSVFLQPYSGARERIDTVMGQIKDLIKDNPKQHQNITSLESLIDRHFYMLASTMQLAPASRDTLHFNMLLGKAAMDRIRVHINSMKEVEQNLLKERESRKEYYLRLTPVSLLFLVFAMLLIIGFSYYGITKQLQQTRKSAAHLDYLNNALLLKNKQLENSVEELNAFNYIASHDLKEPLRKILFFTDVLSSQNYELSPAIKEYLDKIRVSGERMKSLLDDLLTYAQASMMEHKKEAIDLNALLDTVVESLSEMAKEKNARIVYKALPLLQAVPSQMQQLFENLISNSIKYSKADKAPVINIKSNLIAKKHLPAAFEAGYEWYHQIVFSDNGIGFTQDNAEKIFVLFQRLHQRHEFSGTGIGLTICKKIIQNHNGYITASSETDKGATFRIYLPA